MSAVVKRGRPTASLVLSELEYEQLTALTMRPLATRALTLRACIVLACAEGLDNNAVAAKLHIAARTVSRWRARFIQDGLDGLFDAPRPGAPRKIDELQVNALIAKTLESVPPNATLWTTRTMAHEMSMSQAAVSRIWRAFGLQPRQRLRLSDDPFFVETVREIVGLYLDPPVKVMVLSVDEQHPIPAPDHPSLTRPRVLGVSEQRPRADRHHGAPPVIAALDLAGGAVSNALPWRQRSSAFLQFLRTLEASVPPELDMHVVIDTDRTLKTSAIQVWVARHPRFHVHVTPSSAAWRHQVERWFATLGEPLVCRGTHGSTWPLEQAIRQHLNHLPTDPRPFVLTPLADNRLTGSV
ncbi:IS630 family transposase [Burkholderia sp. MS455]|uniref:IS630 family transposase n=1 Tax=Burkholderia sp. MS455 TaxID=2811788 RepID=UPI0019573FEF|nr:IS630 family transposase [Burkholderia sp. MS455]QRR07618.1 IS630 family transposase [Burkholderia sp. MS455]